jgi:hypothetical protein
MELPVELATPLLDALATSPSPSLHTTTSTLFAKHSPTSFAVWPCPTLHTPVHASPIAVRFVPLQHAYRSQNAWSLTARALEMAHAAPRSVGRWSGKLAGEAEAQDRAGPQEKMEGTRVGVENLEDGREVEKVV